MMKIKPPSKTAILDSLPDEKIHPLYWDVDVMAEVAHRNGGIYFSGCKPNTNPSMHDGHCGLDNTAPELAELIRDAKMINQYLNHDRCGIALPEVLETTKDGFTVRALKLSSPHYRYGGVSDPFSILTVRSDSDFYTRLDPATPFVLYRADTEEDQDSFWTAFAIAPMSIGLWVADVAFLMRNDNATKGMRNWFKDSLVDGIFATEDMLVELESRAPEELIEQLFSLRAKYNEDSMRLQANKVAYDFFYGDAQKIRLGIWKVGRGADNFSQRVNRIALEFNNAHSNIEINVQASQAGDVKAINNLDELGLLRKLIPIPRITTVILEEVAALNANYQDLGLKINKIDVPITVKNRRYYVFGFAIKSDEIPELLQAMCCMNDAIDMADLSKDVSLLSLQYRKFLSEGITNTGCFPVRADTNMPFIKRLHREDAHQNAHEFPHDRDRRKMIVQENYTFRFERRGPRGLALVAGKKRYNVYPYDLQRTYKEPSLYYGHNALEKGTEIFETQIAHIKKALGITKDSEAKYIIWSSMKYARNAIRRSRTLLSEVSAEIGAEKSNIRVENRLQDVYIVTGTSGTRYAITDDARYRVFREVEGNTENDRWVFVCIEGSSDQSHEVDKDKLVTRLLALANDTDSVEQIGTLHVSARRLA